MSEILRMAMPVLFGALFIGLILDWIGYLAFWPAFYSIGPRVFRTESPSLRPPLARAGSFIDTASGRFKVGDGKVLLRYRWSLRTHDFTGRGSIEWVNGVARAEARTSFAVPVFVVLGVALFVLGIVSGIWQGIVFGPGIALSYGVIHVWSTRTALQRLLAEYEAWANGEPLST